MCALPALRLLRKAGNGQRPSWAVLAVRKVTLPQGKAVSDLMEGPPTADVRGRSKLLPNGCRL